MVVSIATTTTSTTIAKPNDKFCTQNNPTQACLKSEFFTTHFSRWDLPDRSSAWSDALKCVNHGKWFKYQFFFVFKKYLQRPKPDKKWRNFIIRHKASTFCTFQNTLHVNKNDTFYQFAPRTFRNSHRLSQNAINWKREPFALITGMTGTRVIKCSTPFKPNTIVTVVVTG